MQIDTSQIRSIQTIQKPDGEYIRIGYVERPSRLEPTLKFSQRRWNNPGVKAGAIAAAAAVLFHLTLKILGL